MTPETKNAVETARQPDGKFGEQPRIEVLTVDLDPTPSDIEPNEVLGKHVPHGAVVSNGGFTPVSNSSTAVPHGGLRFKPSAQGSRVSLRPDARVLAINSREDFVRAFHVYPPQWGPNGTVGLDWEMIADDYDAVYVTAQGAHRNRASEDADMYGDLGDWGSCGQVLVLRSDAIESHWR